jgi:hypothetical protein
MTAFIFGYARYLLFIFTLAHFYHSSVRDWCKPKSGSGGYNKSGLTKIGFPKPGAHRKLAKIA